MLSWILAIFVIMLGAKAFTRDGIPLTREKNLHGTKAKICGILCFLFAAFLVIDGLLSMKHLLRMLSR